MDTDGLAQAIDHAIGDELRAQRARKKLTREELVEMSGVSLSTIRRIEGGSRSPDMRQLAALCEALGVSVKMFVATALKDIDVPQP